MGTNGTDAAGHGPDLAAIFDLNPASTGASAARPGNGATVSRLPLPSTAESDDELESGLHAFADRVEGTTNGTHDAILAECVPPSWDFFEIEPERLHAVREKGNDPRIDKIRLKKYVGAKRVAIAGEWDASSVNLEWLYENFEPGKYEVLAVNRRGYFVTGGKVEIGVTHDETPAYEPGRTRATTAAAYRGGYRQQGSIQDRIIEAALERFLQPAAPAVDPMKDSIASLVKLIGVQQASAAQNLTTQIDLMRNGANGGGKPQTDPITALLLKELITSRREETGGVDNAIEALKLGLQLKDMWGGDGQPSADTESKEWIVIAKSAIENLGGPVTSAIAHGIFGAEGAAPIDDLIKEQMRQKGVDVDPEDPDVINTTGTAAAE